MTAFLRRLASAWAALAEPAECPCEACELVRRERAAGRAAVAVSVQPSPAGPLVAIDLPSPAVLLTTAAAERLAAMILSRTRAARAEHLRMAQAAPSAN